MESSTAEFVARQIAYGRLPTIIGLGRKASRSDRRPAAHAHLTLSHHMVFFLLKKTMLPQ